MVETSEDADDGQLRRLAWVPFRGDVDDELVWHVTDIWDYDPTGVLAWDE